MLVENIDKVLSIIKPTDNVLDIGGWAMPFNRANYVLDIGNHETRGIFGSQGSVEEHFSRDTWIIRDLCDKTPYPFPDKFFDYVTGLSLGLFKMALDGSKTVNLNCHDPL